MIQKTYCYIYYKIYKLIMYTSKEFGGEFLTDFKASLVIIALEIFTIISFTNYYNVFFHTNSGIFTISVWMGILLILITIDYFILRSKDQYKSIIQKFDELPEDKNNFGSWVVFVSIFFIITNLIFSFYLYYQN